LIFNSFFCLEQYRESFKYLDADLIQLSKGNFDSSAHTFIHNKLVLDRRVTQASHIHNCTVQLDVLNFVFVNSYSKLNINGVDIVDDNQILVAEREELSAIVIGKLDVTTVSLCLSDLILAYPHAFLGNISIEAHKVRTSLFCKVQKESIHSSINKYIKFLILNPMPSEQFLNDMQDNLSNQLLKYIESRCVIDSSKKTKLSTQELNRLHDLFISNDVLSLKALQSVCRCSPRTLNNLINKHFDCTPNQLVSIVRLNQINSYLGEQSTEKKSIKNICDKFGVYSQHRLSKSYKEMFGKSIQEALKDKISFI
jgi:AraC-like DNA-binding protein